jgi:hypothetical protein
MNRVARSENVSCEEKYSHLRIVLCTKIIIWIAYIFLNLFIWLGGNAIILKLYLIQWCIIKHENVYWVLCAESSITVLLKPIVKKWSTEFCNLSNSISKRLLFDNSVVNLQISVPMSFGTNLSCSTFQEN